MIGCLWTRVRKQPIIALSFEFETVLKFYNLGARNYKQCILFMLWLMHVYEWADGIILLNCNKDWSDFFSYYSSGSIPDEIEVVKLLAQITNKFNLTC